LHQPERGPRFKGREAWLAGSAARLHSLDEDNAALGERVGQLIAVVTEQGFPFWRALGTIHRGRLKVKNGEALAKRRQQSCTHGGFTWFPPSPSRTARNMSPTPPGPIGFWMKSRWRSGSNRRSPPRNFSASSPSSNPPKGTSVSRRKKFRYLYHCHILKHEDNEMMRP
jgi:hypothetical protein